MALFSIETGLRQANVLGLTWGRVDLTRKLVWIEAEDMKGGKSISIPLSEVALNVLKNQKGQHAEFVFTYRGEPIKEIKTAFIAKGLEFGVFQTRLRSLYEPANHEVIDFYCIKTDSD